MVALPLPYAHAHPLGKRGRRIRTQRPRDRRGCWERGAELSFPAAVAAEGSGARAMSQTDLELLLRELGGWDWELCRRELPAVLPRLLISFLRGGRRAGLLPGAVGEPGGVHTGYPEVAGLPCPAGALHG